MPAVSWIDIQGLRKVVKDLESLKRIPSSKLTSDAMNTITLKSRTYWREQVYSYFDARTSIGLSNTGELGRSLKVHQSTKRLVYVMNKIYSHDGTEYGTYLRNGTGASSGMYYPPFDRRIKKGYHPGYDKYTRWEPWMQDFRKYVHHEALNSFRQIVKNWKREKGYE